MMGRAAPYLVTSWHDDMAGISRTYAMGLPRTTVSQVVGSTALFLVVVNSIVAGTLGALVANAAGAPVALVSVLGTAAGLGYLGLMLEIARRSVGSGPAVIRFPTPDDGSAQA